MDHCVGRAAAALVEAGEIGMGGERVERLAVVGEIGDQRGHAGQVERLQVDIEDGIAVGDQMRNGVAAGLAGSAGEYDALAGHGLSSSELLRRLLRARGEKVETGFSRMNARDSRKRAPEAVDRRKSSQARGCALL